MNKLFKKAVAFVMTTAMLVSTAMPAFAEPAKQYDPADPSTVAAIVLNQENSYTLDFSKRAEDEKFEESYVYSMTLENPAIVTFDVVANAFTHNYIGDMEFRVSHTTDFSAAALISKWANGTKGTKTLAYEPGAYYLQVKIIKRSRNYSGTSYEVNPSFSIKATTTDVVRNDGYCGKDTNTAIPTTSGEVSHGLISTDVYSQYFLLDCSGKGKVSVDIAIVNTDILTELAAVTCKIQDEMGKDLTEELKLDQYSYNNIKSGTLSADIPGKGKYFVVISHIYANDNGSKFASINIKPTISCEKVKQLKAPKLTEYKKGAKVVKGTAVAGSKVTVQIKNFVKTVKVNKKGKFQVKLDNPLKKGQKIKVKAKKTGYKTSKTVTYKVK